MNTPGTKLDAGKYGLEIGTPDLASVGPIAFGPDGILFVADNTSAAIFAIGTAETGETAAAGPIDVDDIDTRLAAYLGCAREDVHIRALAAHPQAHAVYLSVMRGTGSDAVPVIVRIGPSGEPAEVPLENVPFARTAITDAPAVDDPRIAPRVTSGDEGEELEIHGVHLRIARDSLRSTTVTELAYVDGLLLVAGASNEEFSSALRRIPFPFEGEAVTNPLEIYHVSHGKYETASPIRTFVPYGGNASVLASYTCTPVVHFSLTELSSGTQARGRTVAELGAMNTPLDMVSYQRDGAEYLLVSNSRHPLFKLACADIDRQEHLDTPGEPVGVPRETLPHEGVSLMANLGGSHIVMLQRDDTGRLRLRSHSTASL